MVNLAKRVFAPPARRGSFSAVTHLGVAVERLAFVASLWYILLTAFSPKTKNPNTLFTIHPLSSPSSLFTNPPTLPSRTAKPIKPPRREAQVEFAPSPPSLALFVCFAVAHTIARHAQDVLGTQQKPAVSEGCGTEESLDIIPIPSTPSETLSKPAVCNGRGIEESADVTTTTPIHESTSNDGDIDTNKTTDELSRDDSHEDADTSITGIQDFEETVALAVSYVLAAAEKTDDEQLRTLAKRIRTHHIQRVITGSTARNPTDEVSIKMTGTQAQATTAERTESVEKEDEERVAEVEESVEGDEGVEVEEEVVGAQEIEEEPEDSSDEMTNECVTSNVASDDNHEMESEDVEEKDDMAEMKKRDDEDEVTDDCASDADGETISEDLDVDATNNVADDYKNVQTAAKPEENASLDAGEDDDGGEWFTIRKGKAIRTSSRPVPPPVTVPSMVPAPPTSPSTVVTPSSEENVLEVSDPESQVAATETCSKDEDWFSLSRAEELPSVPPTPQAIPSQLGRVYIIPANNPKWAEEKAERYRKEMEAWNAFKEAERAAERAKVEEEERKASEVKEAKAARFANFDTTMGRLDGLLKAAREARERWEQKKEENEELIKGIGSAQNRIGEMIDMEKVRAMFDPEVLKKSSFSSVFGQETAIPEPEIAPSSSSVSNSAADNTSGLQQNTASYPALPRILPSIGAKHVTAWRTGNTVERITSVDKPSGVDRPELLHTLPSEGAACTSKTAEKTTSVDKSIALQQNAADQSGPSCVLPSNWGTRYGTTRASKTVERRLRRRRNELRRQEAGFLSNGGGGGGESPQRDGA